MSKRKPLTPKERKVMEALKVLECATLHELVEEIYKQEKIGLFKQELTHIRRWDPMDVFKCLVGKDWATADANKVSPVTQRNALSAEFYWTPTESLRNLYKHPRPYED